MDYPKVWISFSCGHIVQYQRHYNDHVLPGENFWCKFCATAKDIYITRVDN